MKYIYSSFFIATLAIIVGCKAGGNNTGRVYMPDMMQSRAFEAYTNAPEGSPVKYTSLLPVKGTIKRGLLPEDPTIMSNENMVKSYLMKEYYPNTTEGYEMSSELKNPLAINKVNLDKGKELYTIYCKPCHGEAGDGQGPIVASGKYNGVPNYKERLPTINDGKSYYSISYGKNKMGSHSGQISPVDIWKVVMYINTFVGGVPKMDADGKASTAPAKDITVAVKDSVTKK